MSHDAQQAARRIQRQQKLGEDARCFHCGYVEVIALEVQPEGVVCYECARALEGRSISEYHHLIGRKLDSSLAINVPGNVHRLLDDIKRDREITMRRLKVHQPLLRKRELLYAIRDFCKVITPELDRIIEYDQVLHKRLEAHFGSDYAQQLGLPNLWRETGL